MLGHMPESDKRYAVLHMQRTDGRTYVRRPHLQAAKNMQLRNARAHMPYFRGFVMTACDCIDPLAFGHSCPRLAHPARVIINDGWNDLPHLRDPSPRPEPCDEPTDGRRARWPWCSR